MEQLIGLVVQIDGIDRFGCDAVTMVVSDEFGIIDVYSSGLELM